MQISDAFSSEEQPYLHLHGFAETHGMSKEAALSVSMPGLNQFAPHELDAFDLVGLDPRTDGWVDMNGFVRAKFTRVDDEAIGL